MKAEEIINPDVPLDEMSKRLPKIECYPTPVIENGEIVSYDGFTIAFVDGITFGPNGHIIVKKEMTADGKVGALFRIGTGAIGSKEPAYGVIVVPEIGK